MSHARLPSRELGRDGPEVPAIGLGLMGLSTFYGRVPPDHERMKFLDRAYELGETFWDTSDFYGDSEDVIGQWFRLHPERRGSIFLATKFGCKLAPDENGNTVFAFDSTPEYVKQAYEKSIQRLGTDYIDLYYCHRLDMKTPIEKTVGAMAELQARGKVKYLGLSECSSESLRRASKIARISALQVEYSPWSLDIEGPASGYLAKACRELGVAIVAYSPLGRGMMTGRFKSNKDFDPDDCRRTMPRFSDENFPKNLELVRKFEEIAKSQGAKPSQACLAWVMAQGKDVFPIPGTKSSKNLEENLGAFDIKLSEEALEDLRFDVLRDGGVYGERYDDASLALSFQDTPPLE